MEGFWSGDFDTGAAIFALAKAYPNLMVLIINAVKPVSDACLLAIVENCLKLEKLPLMEDDQVKEDLASSSPKELAVLDRRSIFTGQ